jgi:hypothetical protein
MSRPVRRLVPAVAAVLAVLPATACAGERTPRAVPAPAAAPAAVPDGPTAPAAPVQPVTEMPAARPTNVVIPAVDVRTGPLVDLGIDARGGLEVPPDVATAGWFTLGPAPGVLGPAVIAGHAGPEGLFARLHEVVPGDEIAVRRADGTEAVFTAYRVQRYARTSFPTERVYGDTEDSELRLITSGGAADRATGEYEDNLVVFARLIGRR